MSARIAGRLLRWCRSPLFWVLCAAAALRLAGIAWGLPASDGWDDDGVAPRNFLVGLVQTYAPGSHFTYPPLQMILLAVLTAPGSLLALFNAPSLHQHDVIGEMIRVPYMTFFAVVARLVSVAMSVGTVYLIGKMTETVAGRRAGLFAATACALNAALTYYGQVTNLDGPYLFWSALAIWGWMRAIAEHEPRHMRWAVFAAAAAVATKDQAYAVFLFSVPLVLAMWFVLDRWPRQNARAVMLTAVVSTGAALLALLVIDGALVNPSGFMDRIAFLAGPASTDYAQYQADWSGRASLLADMWALAPRYYPQFAILLAAAGIAIHCMRLRRNPARFVAGLLPLLAIISFTVAFNFVALRNEPRFLLPQSVFIAVYIGIAVDSLVFVQQQWLKLGARGAVLAVAAFALYGCMGVVAAFLNDPRYDAERWLQAHVRAGDTIEAYGLNVYLPRFPQGANVSRIGQKSIKARNPLPNVTEIVQPYDAIAARRPRFVVFSAFSVRDYLTTNTTAPSEGRAVQKVTRSALEDSRAHLYFGMLFGGKLSYRVVHRSAYAPGIWPAPNAYESLTQTVWIFERASPPFPVPAASEQMR